MELDQAYKKIFSSSNLHENVSKIKDEYKDNSLIEEVTNFILRDKKETNKQREDKIYLWDISERKPLKENI